MVFNGTYGVFDNNDVDGMYLGTPPMAVAVDGTYVGLEEPNDVDGMYFGTPIVADDEGTYVALAIVVEVKGT